MLTFFVTIALQVVLLGTVVLYGILCGRRFGRLDGPPPAPFRRWSRRRRSVFVWTTSAVLGLIFIPLVLALLGEVIGFNECPRPLSPTDYWPCSLMSRFGLLIGAIAILLPLAIRAGAHLERIRHWDGLDGRSSPENSA